MNEYVTVEELKYTLEIGGPYADANIPLVCESASRSVDDYCGRRFFTTEADEERFFTPSSWDSPRYIDGEFVGYYGNRPYLEVGDLNSVTSVEVDLADDGTYEESWVKDTDYWLEPYNNPLDGKPWDRLVLRSAAGRSFPGYAHSIKITGKWGWTPTPPSVKLAASMLASRFLKRQREAPFGIAGIGPDGEAVRISVSDPDVIALLHPYTIHSVLT